jgi:hypothetical protein
LNSKQNFQPFGGIFGEFSGNFCCVLRALGRQAYVLRLR